MTNVANEETGSSLEMSGIPSPTVYPMSEPEGDEGLGSASESCDQEEVVVFEPPLVPVVEVEVARLPSSIKPDCKGLDETQEEEGSSPGDLECSGTIVGSSPASYFRSNGPKVIRCFQVAC